MKQLKYILTLIVGLIILSPGVKADTIIYTVENTKERAEALSNAINKTYEIIDSYEYEHYLMSISPSTSDFIRLYLMDNNNYSLSIGFSSDGSPAIYANQHRDYECVIYNDGTSNCIDYSSTENNNYLEFFLFNNAYNLYDTNIDFKANTDFEIKGIYDDNIVVSNGKTIPTIKNLLKYSSWIDYESNNSNYTEVNLDDYHYVLLSLKDYSQSKAFDTNLQVKGMIGITPIYDYGQVPKDNVLGSKVEDRCNISYSDYTDYRLYVIDNDLKNRAIYAVKSCQDGSSFKYDSSIFDITYVTDDNVDDPVVVIDGVEYHTIPYDQLPSTATKNEEENYIPGASEEFSFSQIIENITESLESVWNVITTFMGLVTKFFNTLPAEIRVISLTTFTTMCVLGIIKFLKG